MAAAEDLNLLEKLRVVHRTLRNWPLVIVDKLGIGRTVTYATRSDLLIECRTRSSDVHEAVAILSGLEYPPRLLHVAEGAVVLDGGANIGAFSLLVGLVNRTKSITIVAFEPYTPNVALLRRNLDGNNERRVIVAEIALASEDGAANLETTGGFDRVRITSTETATTVSTRKLSTYCVEAGIDMVELLKLDIEGAEFDVIESDLVWIERHVHRLLIEYHELPTGFSRESLIALLAASFDVEVLHGGAVTGVLHARHRRLAAGPVP